MTLEWHASTHFKSLNVCVRLVRTPSKHYARAHTRRQRESEQINLITRSYCHVFRWMETRIASFHFVLFCVFFYSSTSWDGIPHTFTKNIDIWKWREKKSIFLLQMGFGWSEVNLIQKPGSHRRMKHSTETKGHRKKKPTHLDRSQPAYVHTFGNIWRR